MTELISALVAGILGLMGLAFHLYKKSRKATAKSDIETKRREIVEDTADKVDEVIAHERVITKKIDADLQEELAEIQETRKDIDKIDNGKELADEWNEFLGTEDEQPTPTDP